MTVDLSMMTPVKVNSTNLACTSVSYNPGINGQTLAHSGLIYPSSYIRGVNDRPSVTITGVPFRSAYELVGREVLAVTTLQCHLTNFSNGSEAANTTVYQLASGCTGIATISSIGMGPGQTLVATIEILLLSSDGNATVPIESSTAVAQLTLSAEPSHYILGPLARDATVLSGVTSFSANTGNIVTPAYTDGNRYPQTANHTAGNFTANLGHQSPRALIANLTHKGVTPSTSIIAYFRPLGSDNETVGTTGASITIAGASVHPQPVSQSQGAFDSSGVMIQSINPAADNTPTWAVSFSATIPSV